MVYDLVKVVSELTEKSRTAFRTDPQLKAISEKIWNKIRESLGWLYETQKNQVVLTGIRHERHIAFSHEVISDIMV
jgi:hypothetical protein